MKKYDIMTVLGEEKLIMPITAGGNCAKLYALNEVFGHGGRNCMEYEIN